MSKPVVKYHKDSLVFNGIGQRAGLSVPRGAHPKLPNAQILNTSAVQEYDVDSGRLETLNTVYIPE